MSSVPPTPPLKSSQRLAAPQRLTSAPTVRAVDENADPLFFSGPSMRTPLAHGGSSTDIRRHTQDTVRLAAAGSLGSIERPILDRGRPKIGPPESPQRHDSTRSPPRTRRPVNIDYENGFSYIDASSTTQPLRPRIYLANRTQNNPSQETVEGSSTTRAGPSAPTRPRGGSFGSGKPRGLSFHDARKFMRSGQGMRPGSWHEVPIVKIAPVESSRDRYERSLSVSPSSSPSSIRSLSPQGRGGARCFSPFNGISRDVEQGFAEATVEPTPAPPDEQRRQRIVLSPVQSNGSPERRGSAFPLARAHVGAMLGELIGTTSFLFAAFGGTIVASANSPDPSIAAQSVTLVGFNVSRLLYVSLAFGLSYMVNVWIFFRVSEGLFNPAITLARLLTGSTSLLRSLLLLVAQVAGGIAASALALALFQTTSPVRTTLADGVSIPRGLFTEAILTAELVFTILMLASDKQKISSLAPLGIGFALFMGELVGIFWTGGSFNPTRSFGPNVVTWTWDSTHWIYWLGPFIGSLIAVVVYKLLRKAEVDWMTYHADATHESVPNVFNITKEREGEAPAEMLKRLGLDRYADSESVGVINLWHRRPGSSIMGGSLPTFGPSATSRERSDDQRG